MAVKIYTKEYKEIMESVYAYKSEFLSLFGELDVLDGISESATAFTVKTLDIQDVVNEYSTDPNVGMGTGTSKSSRFGPLEEVKAVNLDIPYKNSFARNHAIDSFTVNDNITEVVAKTMAKITEYEVVKMNKIQSEAISDAAGKTMELKEVTADSVNKLFNDLSNYYTNIHASGILVAKVSGEVYNQILDSKLTTTSKASTVNIDLGEVLMFKGFIIEKIADDYLVDSAVVYTYVAEMGKAFSGIHLARTIDEHPDFAGVAVQLAGKYGDYIPEESKKAIVKVKLEATPEGWIHIK